MVILSVTAEGFAELAPTPLTGLGRVVTVGGPPRAQEALALAIELGLGALDAEVCRAAFARLGLAPVVEPDALGAPSAVTLGEPDRLRPLLAPHHGQATLKITLTLSVDPPLFGLLRELAARDPRLVAAIADEDARLTLRVGYAFSADLASVSPALFSVHLGELSLRPAEDKSPAFDALLRALRGRARARGPLELDLSVSSPSSPRTTASGRALARRSAPSRPTVPARSTPWASPPPCSWTPRRSSCCAAPRPSPRTPPPCSPGCAPRPRAPEGSSSSS
ncbi:hypothetical protein L6R49_04335 [Myxococcota bacterium]|nr:hypothetical protein [Myxococcota bacterium]